MTPRAAERSARRPSPRSVLSVDDVALERVLWRVRLRLERRLRWLRSAYGEDELTAVTPSTRLDFAIAGRDDPSMEAAWLAQDARSAEIDGELAEIERAVASDKDSRLARLRDVFGLDPREVDVLHATLAMALDPGLVRATAAMGEGGTNGDPTESSVARLFGHDRRGGARSDGALRRWELVKSRDGGTYPTLEIDPLIRGWLAGRDELDALLLSSTSRATLHEPIQSWNVADVASELRAALDADPAVRLRVQVLGVPGSGRRSFAAAVAARAGFASLVVESDDVDPGEWPRVFARAQRQAFLLGMSLIWSGEALRRRWPAAPDMFALQFVVGESGAELPPHGALVDHFIELKLPTIEERTALWRRYVPGSGKWPARELQGLSRAHRVGPGEIALAARHGPRTATEAGRAVRQSARYRLGDLAQLLGTPFRRSDLVVSPELGTVLDDIVFEAATRASFWERPAARRLFPQGRGLLALFSGPPGTGKTMAAQVIARQLRLDLFRIDLSTVISKYVGESMQNVEKVLRRAARTDAILFFDEADALFGKRTEVRDAHDRFANTDTGHLLQAIEGYQGTALLATNRKGNIDPAFLRRVRYVVEFAKPDASRRLEIWTRLIAELAGQERSEALDRSLRAIADTIDATGAQIKGALLSSLFAARRARAPLAVSHLLRALDLELAKEGRVLSDRERRRLVEETS